MKRLEAVYLANVVLYVRSIETIIKLIQVNKKCQDSTKIIRFADSRTLKENDKNYLSCVNIKQLFDIFPNIETINCWYYDVKNSLEIFKQGYQIELYYFDIFCDGYNLPQEINEYIIKLDINCDSLDNYKLSDFPNVKKIKVEYFKEGYLKEFLGNNQIKLKQLIIQTEDNQELNYLKEYDCIENKIIVLRNKITKERYEQLRQFSNVYSTHPIDGIDFKETLYFYNSFKLTNKYDINRIYELTLFTQCQIENGCDLRNCELLNEVTFEQKNTSSIPCRIEGLKYLKRMDYITNVDCIPSSVTYLSFNPSIFKYKGLVEKDEECFNNVKEVMSIFNKDYDNQDPKLFLNFRNCTKLHFSNIFCKSPSLEIPMSVKELIINKCGNDEILIEISKLTGLKKLEIRFNKVNENIEMQGMFENLKGLERYKTNYLGSVTLPSSVTFLEFEVHKDIDISHLTNLKELKMFCYREKVLVKLPNKLNVLYCCGNMVVTNSKEIDVDKVILHNSNTQPCKWKSKNVIIE